MKMTQAQLAESYGISLSTLKRYKADGVDIEDKDAVEDHKALQPPCNANDGIDTEDAVELKIRKLKAEVGIKEKQDALLHLELQQEKAKLVKIEDVTESILHIAARVKSSMKSFIISLPPKLAGLDERQMRSIIEEEVRVLLEDLHNDFQIEEEGSVLDD